MQTKTSERDLSEISELLRSTSITSCSWADAFEQVDAIGLLPDGWNDGRCFRIAPDMIAAVTDYIQGLRSHQYSVPSDIYPHPDGTVVVEWQFPSGIIIRDEIMGANRGERMISYPEVDKPAAFVRFTWANAQPVWMRFTEERA